MNEAISSMLSKYNCDSLISYENALKEIMQEITLLGLWRAKFFEKAAFYGGTALRILYGLNRFSEDLDFSLLKADKNFDLSAYFDSIKSELNSFGFNSKIIQKEKNIDTAIESAFIKSGTLQNLVTIEAPKRITKYIPSNQLIKIKFEIDIDPPEGFNTESKFLLEPIPFSVNTYELSDLFAGKMHAVLCRKWKKRIKGRDWYDFVWFVGKRAHLHLGYLESRMHQSGNLDNNTPLTKSLFFELMKKKIQAIDIESAKKDVINTLKDQSSITVWDKAFFADVLSKVQFT